MVTDSVAAVEPATPAAGMSYGARLVLTALLLGLYVLGHRVTLPFIDAESFIQTETPLPISLLALRLTPLLAGFLLVELFAVATTPGRRLRSGGPAGRAKLNKAALILSLAMAAVQGMAIGSAMAAMTTPIGAPLVTIPGWPFRIFVMATLTAATAAVFLLGNFLSEYGIGNGFSLLLLTELGLGVWTNWNLWNGDGREVNVSSPADGAWILLAAVFVGLLIRLIQRSEATQTPALPQGVLPVQVTLGILPWAIYYLEEWGFDFRYEITEPLMILVLVPLLCWLTFQMFSSRRRLEANLSEPDEVLDGLAATLSHRFLVSTALLTVGTVVLTGWSWFMSASFLATFTPVMLILAVAIGFDLRDQYLFLQRNGSTARLAQLDNVHFSYRLAARLEEEGIDALARAHCFRSLYFFLGPLVKIDMLVPRDQLDEAREVLAELESAREIRVF